MATTELFQIVKDGDPQPGKALAAIWHGQLCGPTEAPCVAALFYRATDPLNRDFWEDQVRRFADLYAAEALKEYGRGVFLCVHHDDKGFAGVLEVGHHRIIAAGGGYQRAFFTPSWIPADAEAISEDEAVELLLRPDRALQVQQR